MNQSMFYEPLPDKEVLRVVASAWAKDSSGSNCIGSNGRGVSIAASEVDGLLHTQPDALLLLIELRRHHWGRPFVVANAMHERMGWTVKRFAAARRHLEQVGELVLLRERRRHEPALYGFKGGQK
jgi:hypothetical protein